MNFYNKFVLLCNRIKQSPSKVAAAVGARGSVTRWKKGSNPTDLTLAKLLDYFSQYIDISLDDLMSDAEIEQEPAYRVPVLGRVPAGVPIEAIETIIDWEEIPASMARGGKEYFCLEVEGDSMYPDYLPGDRIIVRRQADCDSGDDCVVYINSSDATLKQLKKNADGSIMIIPRNTVYSPQRFSVEEIKNLPISIAGVVVEMRRRKK